MPWSSDVGLFVPMATTPWSPGCELPLSRAHSQLVCSLLGRAPAQISPLFPEWLVSQALGNKHSTVRREMGPQASTQGLAFTQAPRIGFPGRRLEQCWLSPLRRGSPKLGLPAGCLGRTPVFTLLLLFPHPFSHQSSYLWGGQGPPPGKDKKSLQLYFPSSISFIK